MLGDLTGGLSDCDQLESMLEAQGLATDSLMTYLTLTELKLVYENPAAAMDVCSRARQISAYRKDANAELSFGIAEAEERLFIGNWQGLMEELEREVVSLRVGGNLFTLMDVQDFRLLLSALQGLELEAEDLREWMGDETEFGSPSLHHLAIALHLSELGQKGRALETLQTLGDRTSRFCSIPSLMLWWPLGIRAALRMHDHLLAIQLTSRLLTSPAAPTQCRQTAAALDAEARGDIAEALTTHNAAAKTWARLAIPFEHAHSLLGQGRCLTALGRAHEATPILQEAREVFMRLGARPALVETDELLHKVAAHVS